MTFNNYRCVICGYPLPFPTPKTCSVSCLEEFRVRFKTAANTMTTDQKLTVALDALKQIRQLKEETFGDHWSFEKALKTDDVHDIVDQALCFCLPIEEVREKLVEQGIDTTDLKTWASQKLAEIRKRTNPTQLEKDLSR